MFANVLAASAATLDSAPTVVPDAVFTVQGEGERAIVRVLNRADSCPSHKQASCLRCFDV